MTKWAVRVLENTANVIKAIKLAAINRPILYGNFFPILNKSMLFSVVYFFFAFFLFLAVSGDLALLIFFFFLLFMKLYE
jgi:hypothetical protein